MRLSKNQIYKLSDISSDIGLIWIAVVFLPAILDKFELFKVVLGLLAACIFWILSVWLRK